MKSCCVALYRDLRSLFSRGIELTLVLMATYQNINSQHISLFFAIRRLQARAFWPADPLKPFIRNCSTGRYPLSKSNTCWIILSLSIRVASFYLPYKLRSRDACSECFPFFAITLDICRLHQLRSDPHFFQAFPIFHGSILMFSIGHHTYSLK
ncbi:hypothetical protein Desti_0587 [Desulfomonile tiedjei DSM 6799]|uniref:Uncharacterized protein n=1 Tax=Desulfomonile tiedjei (strain ATCC 49306 / DSM 6799 / DCB-1) TaxID=706587 RepID=I4C177_DESTA|nr:hypothetical protein Desti_0587 [Desulfomonile tiedjei DSM 6799]